MRKLYALNWTIFTLWCRNRQLDYFYYSTDQFSTGVPAGGSSTLKVSMAGIAAYHTPLKVKVMVTHTRNSCSAFNPSKVHTRSREHTHCEHTPGAVGSHLCCGARGAVGSSVPCSRAPQSWYWEWRERCTFTPPSYNSCWPESRTRNLWVMSPTL